MGRIGKFPEVEIPFKKGISLEYGEELLKKDVKEKAENDVNSLIKVPLDQREFDVLVDLVFNLGPNPLKISHLLERLNDGDYNAIASELGRFDKITADSGAYKGKRIYSQGIENRRDKEIDLLPPDNLDLLMKFKSYQRSYSNKEITRARELIPQQDTSARGELNLMLQRKIAYHNQRDNDSNWEAGDRRNNRDGKPGKVGDVQCNITSLAMALETVGIFNPDSKNFPQFEDYLEHIGDTQIDNYDRTSNGNNGWYGLAKYMGAKVEFLNASGTSYVDKKWWQTVAFDALKSGAGVMFSIHCHIVRLQDVTPFGIVVDDPYGGEMNFPEGEGGANQFKWGKDAKYGDLDNEWQKNGLSIGNDNVWD
jgi:GH24 family phage-related lysozyme (muramidase)